MSDRVFGGKSWVLIFLPKNRNLHGLGSKFNFSGSFGLFGGLSLLAAKKTRDVGLPGIGRKNPLNGWRVLRIPY